MRPRRCGPFLPKPQPASNRVPLHQRRYRLVSILKAGNPSGLAKRLCVSLAQGLGHPTNVCHRPNGRRRETESRLPYPQGNQATQQGPSAAPVAVHKNTNLVSQFSWEKTQAPPFLQVISLQRGPSAQHGVPTLGTPATDILVKLRTPGNRATRSKKLHLTKAALLLIQSAEGLNNIAVSNPGGNIPTIL